MVVNNLSFVKAAGRMLLNMAGWSSPEKPEPGAGSGHRAVALFLTQQPDEPAAPTRVEILDLRDGDQAVIARQEWDRLARRASEPANPDHAGGELFSLRPAGAGEPVPAGVRLAEIVPDEVALQPNGLAVFRRFLGDRVQAAQECRGDTCITVVGGSPAERVRQADALVGGEEGSSLADSASLPGQHRFVAGEAEPAGLRFSRCASQVVYPRRAHLFGADSCRRDGALRRPDD